MSEFEDWKAREAEDYMERVRRSVDRIRQINVELATQRSFIPPAFSDGEHVSRSREVDSTERFILRTMDRISELETERLELVELRSAADKALRSMPDPLLSDILWLRYMAGYTWRQLA